MKRISRQQPVVLKSLLLPDFIPQHTFPTYIDLELSKVLNVIYWDKRLDMGTLLTALS